MIVAMLNIDKLQESILVVVIEKDNLDRMRKADPFSLESASRGGIMPAIKYPNKFSMLMAYEEDEVELYKIAGSPDKGDLLRYLERGRKFIQGIDGKEHAFKR